jgi:hypothetical protein
MVLYGDDRGVYWKANLKLVAAGFLGKVRLL